MSASDAAPLPRLGEVFFDVRGNSRSMRLSWYADTDVAVFSIWQGGKCTGTFRLPMDDLSRMIEILQRGPEGRSGRRAERRPPERGTGERGFGERGFGERGPGERKSPEYGAREGGLSAGPESVGGYESDRTVVHGGRTSAVSAGDYGASEFGSDDYGAGDYGPPDYRSGDYRPAEHDSYSQASSARYRTEHYEPADYGQPDYDQDGEWWPDGNQADRTGQRSAPADNVGYGEQRFAPPYLDDPEYRPPADPAGRPRHSAGRHSGGQAQ
jgi:hypothetical protein